MSTQPTEYIKRWQKIPYKVVPYKIAFVNMVCVCVCVWISKCYLISMFEQQNTIVAIILSALWGKNLLCGSNLAIEFRNKKSSSTI